MKHIPIGIESFKELIDGEYYYVDKTLFIRMCAKKRSHYIQDPDVFTEIVSKPLVSDKRRASSG